MRQLLVALALLLLVPATASGARQEPLRATASGARQEPLRADAGPSVYTVARGGEQLGYGPRARLKAWRDDARGRLCFRLQIPFRFHPWDGDERGRGRYGVNRALECVPFPARRALTWRPAAFNECYVGGRVLMGMVRSDIARVEVRREWEAPVEARLVRIPGLVPDGALVHAPLSDFNTITTFDAEGRELSSTDWDSPYPGCPQSGSAEFL